ncbi:DegT/DnrJ/EryC1/StrS family aminotransferase [Desulfosporosinus meridiei]|uniref:Putative PLP-dependent enzyme possibly involved in cell wall biogenesis n=1 Tax=Desulfosporosinus meridiei (strain ATCC BAA-275 / DSM 13257 / KCTC 12902 / NCIMB 13706 / S10) TaxID=768704 RepID=J7J3V0_DESMD|nr:DegT/DnrJ/EryC1/StrS family aminotransferase [Desulfosporosinus meridiei]AFQ45948.1 putative PLP-dependent enzyme possibly involved in cell wall biogenesis [Desulfosporosinus meridiei DSM 13257]
MIPLARPDITEKEKQAVLAVLDSNQLSLGPKLNEFEEKMAAYAGTQYAIACNSGTSGLHMIIAALGIKDGDEVITTSFSFISSSNCMLFERAKPVFVDIDEKTYNLDTAQIEEKITARTKAILPVHVFGQPANMNDIRRIALKHGLAIIEDSCEAIGAEWNGKKAGTMSNAGVFAFYPNKQMTTGEGGVVVTNNENLAELCYSLRNQGRGIDTQWLDHVRLGYNYRISDICCALGIAQLERIDEILAKRQRAADLYMEKLKNVKGVILPAIDERAKMSWFVFVIRFEPWIDRNLVMQNLLDRGIGCRPYFTAIHLQPFYREMFGYKEGDLPVTEHVARGTLAIPFFNNITEEQIDRVVAEVRRAIGNASISDSEARLKMM